MQLLQLCWEDQNRLLFKFKKDQSEIDRVLPDTIKSMNLKFELLKVNERASNIIQEPFLLSIKDFQFFADILIFSIQLDKLNDIEDLKIRVIRLTIYYYSGDREEIFINKSFQLSEILFDDGDFFEIMEEEVVYETKTRYSYKKKTSVNKSSKPRRETGLKKIKNSGSEIIKTSKRSNYREGSVRKILVSESEFQKLLKLKGDKTWDRTFFIIRQGFDELSELKQQVK